MTTLGVSEEAHVILVLAGGGDEARTGTLLDIDIGTLEVGFEIDSTNFEDALLDRLIAVVLEPLTVLAAYMGEVDGIAVGRAAQSAN